MGCEISTVAGSNRVVVDTKDASESDECIDNEGKDSKLSGKIDKFKNVLKDYQARQKLRRFILYSWIPVQGMVYSLFSLIIFHNVDIYHLELTFVKSFSLNIFCTGKDSNDLFKSEATTIATNFFDFLLDSNDYSELPKSSFQSYRACFIFEKYLMHGASHNVPITTNVTDECSQTLFGKVLEFS